MGYNSEDSYNLNRASAMFGSKGMTTGHNGQMLIVFPISKDDYGDDGVTVLSKAMMSAVRFDEDVTVWINVQLSYIPTFVSEAIIACSGFSMRLVVTDGSACSHAPGAPLAQGLQAAIENVSDSREVWHPIERKLVPSIKIQD
jgi:hypothetical protein